MKLMKLLVNKNLNQHLILYFFFHFIFIKLKFTQVKLPTYKINIYKKIDCLYSILCLNYTFLGLFMLKYKLKSNYYQSFYPYFLLLQGIISLLSDSIFLHKEHFSHSIDKSLAIYNSIISIILSFTYNLQKKYYFIIIFGFLSRNIGTYFLYKNNIKNYLLFHSIWHTINPFLGMYIIKKDNYKNV